MCRSSSSTPAPGTRLRSPRRAAACCRRRSACSKRGKLALMGDFRRHRGPHPRDQELFSKEAIPALRAAVEDLSWLRTRGYAETSAIKVVGDRYQLHRRQRVAVARCACSESAREGRASRQRDPSEVTGKSLMIDGFNVVTTIEVALAGGVLLLGQDGCMRDMASYHGSYRLVHETERAVDILVGAIESMRPAMAVVYIDRPVSNSGRLAHTIRESSSSGGAVIEAHTADGVDELLKKAKAVVATSDSAILDRCGSWFNLARFAIERSRPELDPLWLLDFS